MLIVYENGIFLGFDAL